MSCALEINSSDGFRLACKMFLFSHEEHISTTNILMISKLGSLASYREGDPPIKSHNSLVLWSCKIIWRTKNIFTTRVSMAIKRGRMVTYCDGLPLLKSYNPLITWFCEIWLQTKTYLYLHSGYGHQNDRMVP